MDAEPEASSFETSEMVGDCMASTPLVTESWKLCSAANATVTAMPAEATATTTTPFSFQGSFVARQAGDTGHLAFSSVQALVGPGLDPMHGHGALVPLDPATSGDDRMFAPLKRRYDGEEPVMVHVSMLRSFLLFHSRPDFQSQISAMLEKSKSIVVTGHSIGGAIASLTALWLLSHLKSTFSSISVLCITFGSPLLGNESLSRAILRERWGGNFCHIVKSHDIMPRLCLDPLFSPARELPFLLHFWQMSMASAPDLTSLANLQLSEDDRAALFSFVVAYMERAAQAEEGSGGRSFWPFGNYMFCSEKGAICLDNSMCVNKMMHMMLLTGSPSSSIEEHLKYGETVGNLSLHFLKRRNTTCKVTESSYEASLAMAVNSSGTYRQGTIAEDCLKKARQMGLAPNLNSANLAIKLSKFNPYRSEIEWYKSSCDKDQRGYYDSFKLRQASRRDAKVNMNRLKLAAFWDDIINMIDKNELPHDFHRRDKWVHGSNYYKLLVEPLDIAEYYRMEKHRTRGHYLKYGRARRYEIFDRWWREHCDNQQESTVNGLTRTRYASLTQDSCFWARVEEAKDWLEDIRSSNDPTKLAFLWKRLDEFEVYATKLVEAKEVSSDVVARNSTFSLWLDEWRELKSRFQQLPCHFSVASA